MNNRVLLLPAVVIVCCLFGGAIFFGANKATEYVLKQHRNGRTTATGGASKSSLPQSSANRDRSVRASVVVGTKRETLTLPKTAKTECEIVAFYTQTLSSLRTYYMGQLQSEYDTALSWHRAKKMSDDAIVQKYAPIMLGMYAQADRQVKLTLSMMKAALVQHGYTVQPEVRLQAEYNHQVEMEMNEMSAKADKVVGQKTRLSG